MEKQFWSADANAGIVTVKNWDGQETTVSLLIVLQAGGSPRKCQSTMPKRSSQNGERSQGSSMGRGSDTYAMAQQVSQGLQSPVASVFMLPIFYIFVAVFAVRRL